MSAILSSRPRSAADHQITPVAQTPQQTLLRRPAWSDLWLIRPGTYQFAVNESVPNGDVAIHRGLAVFDAAGGRAGWVAGRNFRPETG